MKREELLKKITLVAGKETLKWFGKTGVKYTKKHSEDVVTEADLQSEKILVTAIKKHFPEDGIISEESSDYNTDAEYVWIMDPLDGTWNFSKNIPIYGVLVAIAKKREVIAGAAYFPKLDEFYFAQLGKGATLNGKKIICSDKKEIINLRISGHLQPEGEFKKQTNKLFDALETKRCWYTDMGCGAYDMCLVAAGKSHLGYFPAIGGQIWDVAAPYIIMGEAGCKLTNVLGERVNLNDKINAVAANPTLHKKIMKIIK
ncbi:MAG: inositol monophosphatase [Candidatus Woesearchaeota archaeon]|jgi:myo-inositol-1(or 4)-monophosphatase